MRTDSVQLEEERLSGIENMGQYHSLHERHRIFPEIFGDRNHKKIIDIAAGAGIVGKRIKEKYHTDLVCNDVSPTAIKIMNNAGLQTISFDIDTEDSKFPYTDGYFDAVVALATIEHTINTDHFVKEIHRILSPDGFLYISAPNYSGLLYLLPFLFSGKTFHDPCNEHDRYEFYAHVRYFTFRTLLEYIQSFDFYLDTVYVPLPSASSKYQELYRNSKMKAILVKKAFQLIYTLFSPRWASEPVLCFRKGNNQSNKSYNKIVL